MERRLKGEVMRKRKLSHVCLLLLALLQLTTPASAENTTPGPTYSLLPASVTVAVGEPAVFRCEVSPFTKFNLSLHGSETHILSCTDGNVKYSLQALYGECKQTDNGLMAVWTIKGTSFSDNGTQVVCQLENHTDAAPAFLHVYDNGSGFFILIGCTIGGFFGILLVFGFTYSLIRRSETLQKCFRGGEQEDDSNTIVTKE